ncbi:MAG TPA: PepSY-like domain-containing protein [Puia sp.]|nr:PepSY-like domain-containing protein [Puia sp.]
MKKLFFLILPAAFASVPAFAKIPAKVTDAFEVKYTHATNVSWKHMMGKYEADFNMGKYQLEATFDKKGQWLESDKILGKENLPKSVVNNIKKSKYSHWKIKSSKETYMPGEKPEFHVMVTKGDFVFRNLKFDHRGQLMNG